MDAGDAVDSMIYHISNLCTLLRYNNLIVTLQIDVRIRVSRGSITPPSSDPPGLPNISSDSMDLNDSFLSEENA